MKGEDIMQLNTLLSNRIVMISTFLLVTSIGSAFSQTARVHGPTGKMKPGNIQPYEPPPMVLVPEGEYEMGDHPEVGDADERPVHHVYINSFYMDVFEVTNKEYCKYLNSAINQTPPLIEVSGEVVYQAGTGTSYPYCDTDSYSRIRFDNGIFTVITSDKEDHPMVMVTWHGAVAYANWRSVQEGLTPSYDLENWECNFTACSYRLPTEAEWEKAARGGEHNPYYMYPWGDTVNGSMANYWHSNDPYEVGDYPWTTPVGYYDGNQIINGTQQGDDMANGYGLYDMAGNVWEWCNDWYDEDYYDISPYDNPKGPLNGTYIVVRGGCWGSYDDHLRCACRSNNSYSNIAYKIGFRLILPDL